MSNILVTGVAGLVGSNIAKKLLKEGHSVVGVDNFVGGYKDNVPNIHKLIELDCNDLTSDHFKGIDVVIHAACTPHEGLSVFSPKFITDNTFGISMNVLKCSIQAGVKRFIFTSSMARYGQQEVVPFTEDMLPNPQDPYGIAKLAFENSLKILSEVHNLEYVILVPHNIIGPGQVYTDPFRNVAGIMINRMLRGLQPIVYGDGTQMRCFSDIDDVIDPMYKAIFSKEAVGQVINIGPDSNYITINDLANGIGNVIGMGVTPIYMPKRPKEVKFANCSADKARKLLDYNPTTPLSTTLKKMVDWVYHRGTSDFVHNLPVEIVNDLTPKTWTDKSIFNS